jgi:hypothetical protein
MTLSSLWPQKGHVMGSLYCVSYFALFAVLKRLRRHGKRGTALFFLNFGRPNSVILHEMPSALTLSNIVPAGGAHERKEDGGRSNRGNSISGSFVKLKGNTEVQSDTHG